jgi:ubiquinone/menaquinone biosynthesis C-methylase UbiE
MNYTEPHVAIPDDVIPVMLELGSVKPDETVFDLGSGDGRIVIAAARDFGAKAVGVELRRRLVIESRKKIRELGLSGRAKVTLASFKKVSLRKADVLCTYLSSYTLNLIVPKLQRELRPGARVVNFDYPIEGWLATEEILVKPAGWKKAHPVYLYAIRAKPWENSGLDRRPEAILGAHGELSS